MIKDPEERKAYLVAWRLANPDKVKAYDKRRTKRTITKGQRKRHAARIRESRRKDPAKAYAQVKAYSAKNPESVRQRQRKHKIGYHAGAADARNRRERWEPDDDARVLAKGIPDKLLAKLVKRSVQAVQARRFVLKNKQP